MARGGNAQHPGARVVRDTRRCHKLCALPDPFDERNVDPLQQPARVVAERCHRGEDRPGKRRTTRGLKPSPDGVPDRHHHSAARPVANKEKVAADIRLPRDHLRSNRHALPLNERRRQQRIANRAQVHELKLHRAQPNPKLKLDALLLTDLGTQLSDQGTLRPLDTLRRHGVLLKPINLLGLLPREVPQVADLPLRARRRDPQPRDLVVARRPTLPGAGAAPRNPTHPDRSFQPKF
jgi:hypothetical protein